MLCIFFNVDWIERTNIVYILNIGLLNIFLQIEKLGFAKGEPCETWILEPPRIMKTVKELSVGSIEHTVCTKETHTFVFGVKPDLSLGHSMQNSK